MAEFPVSSIRDPTASSMTTSMSASVTVSTGPAQTRSASNTFRIESVLAHGVRSQADTVGGPHLGPITQQPKSHIDAPETH
ncbi:hypothetical protein [Streptomyces sp. NPDC101776]|uniref:hypothetical protein n=1 Tax=Streptomyces sp. NPDC101776 TaxID=3366146 RepID=UPI00382E6240